MGACERGMCPCANCIKQWVDNRIATSGGGGSSLTLTRITASAYNALPDAEKNNPLVLWIVYPG